MSSQPTRIMRPKVTWGSAKVTEIPYLNKEELSIAWYSKKEYKEIDERLNETVELMMSKVYIDESCDEHCVRGLECNTLMGALNRRESKRDVFAAVFDTQRRLQDSDMNDPNFLAKASRDASSQNLETAIRLGKEDAAAIQEDLVEVRKKIIKLSKKERSLMATMKRSLKISMGLKRSKQTPPAA